jgi:UDP-N-acetylglucosamine--N-acetylmuramyl-(pentapeptide) pyrophosphoryl-undecaprenol N-acetylglucosamine transferase
MTRNGEAAGAVQSPIQTRQSARRRFVIAGGGTGGHVTLALALGEVLAALDEPILFLGTTRGLETRLVPEAGFELVTLPSRQAVGQSALARIAAVGALVPTTLRAWRVLRKARAGLVISVGGYAALPAVLAALPLRIPIAVVEPNARPGRANRMAARFATRIFVGFEAASRELGGERHAARVRCLGIPLRRGMREAFRESPARRALEPPLRLLVFGGSQGARQLNEAMIEAAPALRGAALEVFHQSGAADRDRVAAAYARAGVRAEVVAFERDMPTRYRWADLALCRAGALSIAELALAGLPALLVPLPHAADDHQSANARQLVNAGAARMFDPRRFEAAQLVETLLEILEKPDRLVEMQRSAAALGRPRAADEIVHECRTLLAAGRR